MSSITDFLFGGQAPPNVTSGSSSSTTLPQWLQDRVQGLVEAGVATAGQGYQTYQGPRVAGLNQDQKNAYQSVRTNQGNYNPALASAGSNLSAAAQTSGAAAAKPYLDRAAGTVPENVQSYLNPYTSNVTDRAKDLALRSWNEDIMPGISDIFVRNGTYASSGMADKVIRGGRGVAEGIQKQSLADLADAYNTSAAQYQTDASRIGGLGATAGNLAGNDAERSLQAATGFGGLAELTQKLGLNDASALEAIGNTEQGQTQKNYDLAYQDFQGQRDYDKTQLDWLNNLLTGAGKSQGTTTKTETGPLSGAEYGASGLSQLGSAATGIAGLLELLKKAKGGT